MTEIRPVIDDAIEPPAAPVAEPVRAPPNYRRTLSGRRSGAFTVFASFAVTEENFARATAFFGVEE